MRRSIPTLCCLLLLATVCARADEPADLLRTLQRQLAAGDHEAALPTARRCVEVLPGEAALWYNLAGLEEQHGERTAAVAAFREAVNLGFDDFRHADADADLGDLTADPAYRELRRAWAGGLATRTGERALALTADTWSARFALPDRRGGLNPPEASARLRATADGLEVEVVVAGGRLDGAAVWQGGSGILVGVTLPEDPRTGEGRLGHEFAIGLADGLPSGAVRLGASWQRLTELTPKLRRDQDTGDLSLGFSIPWQACGTLHPLADETLAVNLVFVRRNQDAADGRAAWIADPALGQTGHRWRRGVPVTVAWPASSGPLVRGRLEDTLIRGGTPAAVTLAVVAPDAHPQEARLVLRDHAGTIRLDRTIPVTGGPGRRLASVDLPADLPAGPLRLGASITGASWDVALVSLPAGWLDEAAERLTAADPGEQPSLRYRQQAIAAALQDRLPRQDCMAMGTTILELAAMLDNLAATGTSLPAGGTYLAVLPAEGDQPALRCSLALPAGWRRGDPVRTLLLLARAPGAEPRAVTMAPRVIAERWDDTVGPPPAVVIAVPHLPPQHDPALALARTERLLGWLRRLLDCGPLHLAGVDLLAATALETAAAQHDDLAAVLAITGMHFVPYPGEDAETIGARLKNIPPDLPVGWIWFPDEMTGDDQAAAMRRLLAGRQLPLDPQRSVPGGLDFSQAWARAALWAAGLPQ